MAEPTQSSLTNLFKGWKTSTKILAVTVLMGLLTTAGVFVDLEKFGYVRTEKLAAAQKETQAITAAAADLLARLNNANARIAALEAATRPAPVDPAAYRLTWTDRRPFGMYQRPGANIQFNGTPTPDVAAFLAHWKNSVENCVKIDAQAIIAWNFGDNGYDCSPSEWSKISGIPESAYQEAAAYAKARGIKFFVAVSGWGVSSRDAAGVRTFTEFTPQRNDPVYRPEFDDLKIAGCVKQIKYAVETYGAAGVYIDSNPHQGDCGLQFALRVASAVPGVLCIFENYEAGNLPKILNAGTVLYSFDHYEAGVVQAPQFAVVRMDRWLSHTTDEQKAAWLPGLRAESQNRNNPFAVQIWMNDNTTLETLTGRDITK